MRNRISHIALFHSLKREEKTRVDFETEISMNDIFESLKIEGYNIYQLILSDNKYVLPEKSLVELNIKFEQIKRTRKSWFGLSSKTTKDIVIFPSSGFYYPYEWGTYTYIYTKNVYSTQEIDKWLHAEFPRHWIDLDDTHAGFNSETLRFIDSDDYVIVTNHDYQTEFGITGNSSIIKNLKIKLKDLNLDKYEETIY